jgi:predicted small lipoprotein YifL
MSKPITPARCLAASIATVLALTGCGRQAAPPAGGDATKATQQVNAQFAKDLKLGLR